MKAIKLTPLVLILILTLMWWHAESVALSLATGVFPWRSLMVQYFGVLTLTAMSIAILLAVRPILLESYLGGLDKMYRLHKWLGISVLVLSICHWLWVKVPKWLVEAGWLVRPLRAKRPEQSVEVFRFFQSQRELAEQIGEWVF